MAEQHTGENRRACVILSEARNLPAGITLVILSEAKNLPAGIAFVMLSKAKKLSAGIACVILSKAKNLPFVFRHWKMLRLRLGMTKRRFRMTIQAILGWVGELPPHFFLVGIA